MNATQEARATLGMNDADWCEFCTDFHTASCDDCCHGIPVGAGRHCERCAMERMEHGR